jgi:hypothetical protein
MSCDAVVRLSEISAKDGILIKRGRPRSPTKETA